MELEIFTSGTSWYRKKIYGISIGPTACSVFYIFNFGVKVSHKTDHQLSPSRIKWDIKVLNNVAIFNLFYNCKMKTFASSGAYTCTANINGLLE